MENNEFAPDQLTNVVAIKRFFESNGGKKVTTAEIMQLSKDERETLGYLAREELKKAV